MVQQTDAAGPDRHGFSRREALRRFAILSGAAALGPLASVAQAAGAGPARRSATFLKLVETFASSDGIVDLRGRDMKAEYEARRRSVSPEYREWLDSMLDALEVAPRGGSFSALSATDRRRALRDLVRDPDPDAQKARRPLPGDLADGATLDSAIERHAARIKAFTATLRPEDLELDEVTGLPRFDPAPPPKEKITVGGPLDSPVRQRYFLHESVVRFAQSFFVEDPRALIGASFA